MAYTKLTPPTTGTKITVNGDGSLNIPNDPIIPFIEGDGIGVDIWKASQPVLDAAVEKAYKGEKKINWFEIYAGEKAVETYGDDQWLPEDTLEAIREYRVAIKGPLTTPVGGGIRSLNVSLRQFLDLYACVRPVRYFDGVPSPVKDPQKLDVVIFRENTEDVYSGMEWQEGTPEAESVIRWLNSGPVKALNKKIRTDSGVGIKPVSATGSKRLIKNAIQYAIDNNLPSVTLVHKGNIMKFTEGGFRDWGYEVAKEEYGAEPLDGGPWHVMKNPNTGTEITIKDVIADAMLQQILTRPAEYDVIATLNLNGDYISDALAAQVGGIGIAPGANINYETGHALFEATHGTAPKYTGQDKVNPGSVILSGEMMLRYMGWVEAADLVIRGMSGAIGARTVTYDFERLMEGATLMKCSEFGDAVIEHL